MSEKFEALKWAGRAWPILVDRAVSKMPITYGELARLLDVHPRTCRFFLSLIQYHCKGEGIPPLQSIVVNKATDKPGEGYWATSTDDMGEVHKFVFDFDWTTQENPFL